MTDVDREVLDIIKSDSEAIIYGIIPSTVHRRSGFRYDLVEKSIEGLLASKSIRKRHGRLYLCR